MPSWCSLVFQDPATRIMGELSGFYDTAMVLMFLITLFITYIFFYLFFSSFYYKSLSESTGIEVIWSLVPAFLVGLLAFPSMGLLYMMEDVKSPSLTFKVVAHQWYWTYVSPLFHNLSFSWGGCYYTNFEEDSMMDPSFLEFPRLLGCSSDLVVPVNTTSRLLITSTDVIHSFALPSMGLKVDAIPGRINQLFVEPSLVGQFFGQCSEICGSNHSFMPISVKVCGLSDYDLFTEFNTLSVFEESF